MRRALMIGTALACLGLAGSAWAQAQGGTGNHNYSSPRPLMAAPPPPPVMAAQMAPAPRVEDEIADAHQGIDQAQAAHKIGSRRAHHLRRQLKAAESKLGRLSHDVLAIQRKLPG